MNAAQLERFMAKVRVDDDGCWTWTAAKVKGYGRFGVEGRRIRFSHRLMYEHLVGPVPQGLQLDHLCRNRACCNPEHLEPVTCRENLVRGTGFIARQVRQTACHRGHEFTDENTYRRPDGKRNCRACRRKAQACTFISAPTVRTGSES